MAEESQQGYWDRMAREQREQGFAPPGPEPRPAYALGPDGKPVPFDTEGGFERQAAAPPGQLTAEEIAEFRELRAEKKRADEKAAKDAEEAASRLQEPTHRVLLAGGEWVEGSTIASHYDNGHGLVPVVSTHAIDPVLIG